jgi:hypothetical protein
MDLSIEEGTACIYEEDLEKAIHFISAAKNTLNVSLGVHVNPSSQLRTYSTNLTRVER